MNAAYRKKIAYCKNCRCEYMRKKSPVKGFCSVECHKAHKMRVRELKRLFVN